MLLHILLACLVACLVLKLSNMCKLFIRILTITLQIVLTLLAYRCLRVCLVWLLVVSFAPKSQKSKQRTNLANIFFQKSTFSWCKFESTFGPTISGFWMQELYNIYERTFSGFHQTAFSFFTAHSTQQLFSQLTA